MILFKHSFRPGDWVIYRKQKSSTTPGPRAENVHAASKGNLYRYTVDKYWVVESITEEGRVLLRTRRGKRHTADPNDPQLRKARFWVRWLYRDRFEAAQSGAETTNAPSGTSTDSRADDPPAND
ncbi:hypothetical protein [Novipirellula sp.]|uniref:hypothetical protein n=1 Tax=Novipirellula sp. TaxID=2795430 RepID=UPI00356468BE